MDYEKMMAELRDEYIASMQQKIIEIKMLADASDTKGLREIFHKLKGSGKTYGIPEVSELFEVCEKLCLNKPQVAPQISPLALKLFTAIYETRKSGQSFSVITTPEFAALRAL